ncbi:hypothetical protein Tco_1527019, partial [Tanacetum coccineum]
MSSFQEKERHRLKGKSSPSQRLKGESSRKPRSDGLGESNHMKAIFVRESREMEDG